MSPEDMQRFRVYGVPYPMALGIHHVDCPSHWYAEVEDLSPLSELVQRAEEHTEVCR